MTDLFAQPDDATPLDTEEREGLLQTWITTRADLNEAEQANIDAAVAWVARRRKADLLTDGFVFELHRRMFGDVWAWAGSTRRTGKNIGIDPRQIHVQLGALLRDARYWIDNGSFLPDVIALRLHHGLVAVHPFPNGNGRHARLMADLLIADTGGEPFTWGGEPCAMSAPCAPNTSMRCAPPTAMTSRPCWPSREAGGKQVLRARHASPFSR